MEMFLQLLTSSTSEWKLRHLEIGLLANVTKMRPYWRTVQPLPNVTGVLTGKGNLDTETDAHTGEAPREDQVMLLPATDLPDSERGQGQIRP